MTQISRVTLLGEVPKTSCLTKGTLANKSPKTFCLSKAIHASDADWPYYRGFRFTQVSTNRGSTVYYTYQHTVGVFPSVIMFGFRADDIFGMRCSVCQSVCSSVRLSVSLPPYLGKCGNKARRSPAMNTRCRPSTCLCFVETIQYCL